MLFDREAHPDILRRFREIDPEVDLFYRGEGRWLLGSVRPNRIRYRAATAAIGRELRAPKSLQRAGRIEFFEAMRRGFAPIMTIDAPEPTGEHVEEFRMRDWQYRNRADRAFEEALDASTKNDEAQIRAVTDYVEAEFPSIQRITMRHRRTI